MTAFRSWSVLKHNVFRANDKQGLKTAHSDRQITLVGAALFAAEQFPEGLSRYSSADSAATLCDH